VKSRHVAAFAPLATAAVAAAILLILLVAGLVNARLVGDLTLRYHALRTAFTADADALRMLLDEETGLRGYVATGDRTFLKPYFEARAGIAPTLVSLRAQLAAAGEPALAARADRMLALYARWDRQVARPSLAAGQPSRAIALQQRGKSIVDAFRAEAAVVRDGLAKHSDTLLDSTFAKLRVVSWITLSLIVLVAIAIFSFAAYQNRIRQTREREFHEREVAEESLHRLETLVQAMPQMVWIAGPRGEAVYFNDRWRAYTGKSPDNMFGPRDGIIHPDDLQRALETWRAAIENVTTFEIEYRLRGVDGNYRWFVGRGIPEVDDEGTIVRWFGTCTDVEDQKRASETRILALQRIADAFHRAQLPQRLPTTPEIAFDATYAPARDAAQFGGDWYDVFTFDERRFFFSMGDVTGHGLDAAVTMSRMRQAIFTLALVERDPATILERVNRLLMIVTDELVTAVCGTIDAETGEFTYASAGHPPALVVSPDGAIREMTSSAPPLGFSELLSIPRRSDRLNVGEMLVCYTDGIVEYAHDVIAGERRLHAVVAEIAAAGTEAPARTIAERVLGVGQRGPDDVAVLVIARTAAARRSQDTATAQRVS